MATRQIGVGTPLVDVNSSVVPASAPAAGPEAISPPIPSPVEIAVTHPSAADEPEPISTTEQPVEAIEAVHQALAVDEEMTAAVVAATTALPEPGPEAESHVDSTAAADAAAAANLEHLVVVDDDLGQAVAVQEAPVADSGNGPSTTSRPRGRPPNINENSLLRRLECLLAVERGQISMKEACERYAISARTFYRWLSDKERLMELTGYGATVEATQATVPLPAPPSSVNAGPQSSLELNPDDQAMLSRKRAADVAFPSPTDFSEKRRLPATRPRTAIRTPGAQHLRPHVPSYSPVHHLSLGMTSHEASPALLNGATLAPPKTRVTLHFGEAVAILGWHHGATADEIRESITRRFGIDESAKWSFVDADGDELVVSHVIPSGTYKIVIRDNGTPVQNDKTDGLPIEATDSVTVNPVDENGPSAPISTTEELSEKQLPTVDDGCVMETIAHPTDEMDIIEEHTTVPALSTSDI